MIQNATKRIRKNVINETAIYAANLTRSIYLLIMIDTLLVRPSLHYTTLHPATFLSTSLYLSTLQFFPFKLHPTTPLHFSTLSFGLTPFKFPTAHRLNVKCDDTLASKYVYSLLYQRASAVTCH
jgi:hypothetical protein